MPIVVHVQSPQRTVTLPAATGTLRVKVSPTPAAVVVKVLDPSLEARNAFACKRYLRELAASGAQAIIVDLSMVTFLDTSALGSLVAAMNALGGAHNLILASAAPTVHETLRLTRLDDSIVAVRSVAEALQRLQS